MTTSNKQIEANRANAKRSTGPKTEAGRGRSRWNSSKHGLTAEVLVVGDEDTEDFRELREGLMKQYDPQGAMECELVERLAGILWRLRRALAFEAAVIDFRVDQVSERQRKREQEQAEEDGGLALLESSITLGNALTTDFAFTNSLHKLGRHETSLMNSLTKTQQMLLDLQSSRPEAEAAVAAPKASPSRLRAA